MFEANLDFPPHFSVFGSNLQFGPMVNLQLHCSHQPLAMGASSSDAETHRGTELQVRIEP
ncbi:hypothetical protein M5D96_011413 [Drosophila gunungcola]|nr:hypothetical protein M5D96_011413 [Drosophila gunungcola]